jgi:hypothetical protein
LHDLIIQKKLIKTSKYDTIGLVMLHDGSEPITHRPEQLIHGRLRPYLPNLHWRTLSLITMGASMALLTSCGFFSGADNRVHVSLEAEPAATLTPLTNPSPVSTMAAAVRAERKPESYSRGLPLQEDRPAHLAPINQNEAEQIIRAINSIKGDLTFVGFSRHEARTTGQRPVEYGSQLPANYDNLIRTSYRTATPNGQYPSDVVVRGSVEKTYKGQTIYIEDIRPDYGYDIDEKQFQKIEVAGLLPQGNPVNRNYEKPFNVSDLANYFDFFDIPEQYKNGWHYYSEQYEGPEEGMEIRYPDDQGVLHKIRVDTWGRFEEIIER